MREFAHFAAIDWSGAKGERHLGITIAVCEAGTNDAPRLLRRGHRWSRTEVLHWLVHEMPLDTLVGLDLGISLPFADLGGFFPGWYSSPPDARSLWQLVESICAGEPHLGANSFVDHPQASAYFRRPGGREGALFHAPDTETRRGRFRVTELAQAALCGCKPYSNFNLVGAAQVGKSSLTGMRLLHRMSNSLPVWPVDALPSSGSVVVEIYTSLAAIAAGRKAGRTKMRNAPEVDDALTHLASAPLRLAGDISDHEADALVTAAWLRHVAGRAELWSPRSMSDVAQTEGWTFGVP